MSAIPTRVLAQAQNGTKPTEQDVVVNLRIRLPGPDEPGYFARLERAVGLYDDIENGKITRQTMADMAGFLLDYVEGGTPEENLEFLRQLSENQFKDVFQAMISNKSAVPPEATGGDSGST